MKPKQLAWVFLFLLLWNSVVAQQPASSTATNAPSNSNRLQQISGGKITTRAGDSYEGVVVQRVDPDGVVIGYALTGGGMGISKLKFQNLPDNLQQQFGYNSTNAAAFEKEQKQAEGQRRAKWIVENQKAQSKRQEEEIVDAEARAKWVGTGFFITDDGYLLTCFHVVNHSAATIQVGTKHGLFDAELVQSDSDRDVALLKVTGTFCSLPLVSSNSVNFGEAVFTIGFPNPGLQGLQPKLTRGEVSGLSGFQDDTNEYQISVPVQPGNSGGALVDEYGNVVGIVAARLSDEAAVVTSGMIAQNVNYAIKSSCAKTLLDSLPGGPLKLKPENPSGARKFEDLVRASQDAVALVLVYNK